MIISMCTFSLNCMLSCSVSDISEKLCECNRMVITSWRYCENLNQIMYNYVKWHLASMSFFILKHGVDRWAKVTDNHVFWSELSRPYGIVKWHIRVWFSYRFSPLLGFRMRSYKQPISCPLHGRLIQPLACSRDVKLLLNQQSYQC